MPQLTGTQINYYAVCHRKLWLFSHGIEMEREDDNVQLGKLIGEASYAREEKEINLDDVVVIDWAEAKVGSDGVLTIHEVKKSKAVSQAHRLQMLYYLWYLRQKGVVARGRLDYPETKQSEIVELTAENEAGLLDVMASMDRLIASEVAPDRLSKKSFCQKCAYFELCWAGEES